MHTQGVVVPNSSHLYPFQVGNSTYLAAAGILSQTQPPTETSIIYQTVAIDPQMTDYYNRWLSLTVATVSYVSIVQWVWVFILVLRVIVMLAAIISC